MRLREKVRPPERFNSEQFYAPPTLKNLRGNRTSNPPSNINYNPSLPPAAFPTLDSSRVHPITQRGEDCRRCDEVERERKSDKETRCRESENDNNTQVDFHDIPIDEIDNYVASNGALNPVYVRNMAIMAGAGQSSPLRDKDIDGNGTHDMADDRQALIQPVYSVHDSQWSDLSPAIGVEICDNLLKRFSWKSVFNMLGLDEKEQETVQEAWASRDRQLETEDSQLEEMRHKQLRALMRRDKQYQFVFRKISRQSTLNLLSMKPDYFMCRSEEIARARRFLSKRGIDPAFAGEWSNSIIVMQDFWDNSTESLDFKLCSPKAIDATPAPDPIVSVTRGLSHNDLSAGDTAVRKGDLETPAGLSDALPRYSNSGTAPRSNGLVCLKIGTERAAQIRSLEQNLIEPSNLVRQYPPLDCYFYDPLASGPVLENVNEALNLAISPETPPLSRPVFTYMHHPLRRTLGGKWSYDSAELNPNFVPTTSSMRLQRKLRGAKLEAQQENRDKERRNSEPCSTFLVPRRDPVHMIRSQSTVPARVPSSLCPKFIESGASLTPGNTELPRAPSFPLTNTSSESGRESNNRGIEDTPFTSPSADSHPGSPSMTEKAIPKGDASENGDEECDYEVDEMILVPTDAAG